MLYYTVRLADRCGIDLAAAAERKMEQNIAKYPADRCFGSSAKYTAYQDGSGDSGGDSGCGGGESGDVSGTGQRLHVPGQACETRG